MASSRWSPLVLLPVVTFLVHAVTVHGYGWFRDEFYYVACAQHLAWGYVDQPPLSIALLAPVLALFGPSVIAMRLVMAVVAAVTVAMVGLITREIGGGTRAQALAMLAALVAPAFLAFDFFYSMNAFDLLAWAVAVYVFLRALATNRRGLWIALGVVLGLGLLNKISVLWFGAGVAAGLVLSPVRRVLLTLEPYLAGAVAGLIFAPHVLWQIANGWPTLEFIHNAGADKMAVTSVGQYTLAQVQLLGPASLVVAIAGFVSLVRRSDDARLRVLAIAWIAIFGILAFNGTSRAAYMAPAYTWLLAAGGVAIERWAATRSRLWVPAAASLLVVAGVAFAPIVLPILPVDRYVRYAQTLGIAPSTEERNALGALPQFFADMTGWPALVDSVEQAAATLPPDVRAHAAFLAGNYGEAGAVAVLGHSGLPVYSAHNNFWLWGPPPEAIDAIVVFADHPERLAARFEHVMPAGVTDCGTCMPYENHRAIYVAWGKRGSWAEWWPALKHYE
jgi:hypothetical protein